MIPDINISNYLDDKIPFVSGDTPVNIVRSLGNTAEKPFEWFTSNPMITNHDKCHLLMGTLTPISIKVKDYIMKK